MYQLGTRVSRQVERRDESPQTGLGLRSGDEACLRAVNRPTRWPARAGWRGGVSVSAPGCGVTGPKCRGSRFERSPDPLGRTGE